MKDIINPESLFSSITQDKLPPIETWDPPYCGEIDICIHADSRWSYNGSIINRISLVKLFARVLKREDDDYFLVTPIEKVKIQVETEPFITIALEQQMSKPVSLAFKTNLGQVVIAGKDHPIKVKDVAGTPYPTVHVRNNLHALISRSDFYQLVELASTESTRCDGRQRKTCYVVSGGCKFILGDY